MSRSKNFEKRPKDLSFVNRLIGSLIKGGKKVIAEKHVGDSMLKLEKKLEKDAEIILKEFLDKIKPDNGLRKKKVASYTYQIPINISEERKYTIAIKWLKAALKEREERTLSEAIFGEIYDVIKNNKGITLKKKESTSKLSEYNKAFVHYL